MLVSDVLDEAYNHWIYPAGVNRPAYDVLTSAINDTTPTIPVSARVQNVPRDTIIEIGSETILVASVSSDGLTITAQRRGHLDTDPAAHASGDLVFIDPKYPRKALFKALQTLLRDLYGQGVYAVLNNSAQTFTRLGLITLPTGARRVQQIVVNFGTTYDNYHVLKTDDYKEYRQFSPIKVQLRRGGWEGAPMTVTYVAPIVPPTAETDDLNTLNVPDSLQPHLSLGVAGYLLQSREIPRVQIDEIKRLLASQNIQVGAALNVGGAIYRQYLNYVKAERVRLEEADPQGIVIVR